MRCIGDFLFGFPKENFAVIWADILRTGKTGNRQSSGMRRLSMPPERIRLEGLYKKSIMDMCPVYSCVSATAIWERQKKPFLFIIWQGNTNLTAENT